MQQGTMGLFGFMNTRPFYMELLHNSTHTRFLITQRTAQQFWEKPEKLLLLLTDKGI